MRECTDPAMAQRVRAFASLKAGERAELEEHLEHCPTCRGKVRFYQAVDDVLHDERDRAQGGHPAPQGLLAYCGLEEEALSPGAIQGIEEHLKSCASCREVLRLATNLAEEKDLFFKDSERIGSTEAKARAARLKSLLVEEGEESSDPSLSPWSRPAVLSLAAAAALFLLGVHLFLSDYLPPVITFAEDQEYRQSVYRSDDSVIEEYVRIYCETNHPGWVYCFGKNSDGKFHPLNKDKQNGGAVRTERGKKIMAADLRFNGEEGEEGIIILVAFKELLEEGEFSHAARLLSENWEGSKGDEGRLEDALASGLQERRPSVRVIKHVIDARN